MKTRIAPSLLSADFTRLESEIRRVEDSGTDIIHLDVMDGHFVPNLTIGPCVIESLRNITKLHFDVHLMIDNPVKYIDVFAKAGADCLTVHLEVCPDPTEILNEIGRLGIFRGLAINPDMPVEKVAPFLNCVDRLLVMSVFPGFGGQSFIPESMERFREAKKLIADRNIELETDGGVNLQNAAEIRNAGVDLLVAGTAAFKCENMAEAVSAMLV